MKNSIKFFCFMLFALILSFAACTGDTGPMGAVGPVGEQGEQGEQGPQGEQGEAGEDGTDGTNGQDGEDGEDGNANVFSSPWWTPSWSSTGVTFGSHDQSAPEITQEDLGESAIFVYLRVTPQTTYILPLNWNTETTISYYTEVGNVRVWFESTGPFTPTSSLEFRYVIIPSSGRLAPDQNPKDAMIEKFAAAGVDHTNYDQVAKYLNLED